MTKCCYYNVQSDYVRTKLLLEKGLCHWKELLLIFKTSPILYEMAFIWTIVDVVLLRALYNYWHKCIALHVL